MRQTESNRMLWPDILKSMAIFLVILGHVSSVYDSRGYSSPLALWIYSFHMPLFMMLSGMFFKRSLCKDFKSMLVDKSRLLLLPLFCWGVVNLTIEDLLFTDINDWERVIVGYVKSGGPLRGYWYLKCLFLYLVVNYMLVKLTKRLLLAALLSIALFLLLPNINFSRMMIVFFWFGVFYEDLKNLVNPKRLFIIATIVSMVCYLTFDLKATYLCSSEAIIKYIQFLLMGASASLFWMTLFELSLSKKTIHKAVFLLQKIGTLSLGIYCIHEFFYFEKLYRPVFDTLNADNIFIQIIYSVVVLIVSFMSVRLISHNKYTALVFLGRKWPSKQ